VGIVILLDATDERSMVVNPAGLLSIVVMPASAVSSVEIFGFSHQANASAAGTATGARKRTTNFSHRQLERNRDKPRSTTAMIQSW
jgi:hypothetical protein